MYKWTHEVQVMVFKGKQYKYIQIFYKSYKPLVIEAILNSITYIF